LISLTRWQNVAHRGRAMFARRPRAGRLYP